MEEWAGQTAHSSRFLEFYTRLLDTQAQVEDRVGLPEITLTKDEIDSRLQAAQILVTYSQLDLDWDMVKDAWVQVVCLFNDYTEVLGKAPAILVDIPSQDMAGLVKTWYEGGEFPEQVQGEPVDAVLLTALIQQTMHPFLTGFSQAYSKNYNQKSWYRNYCPVCGGKPEFAYLEKEVGARYLLCSRCASEWLAHRIECPYCANTDHKNQSYLIGDNEYHRLYLCNACKCYLKAVDLRKGNPNTLIPLEALITVAMDKQARELGYHPGS